MSFGKNQLTNISNNSLISNSNKIWRKNDGQHARSAARELELQQKLKLQAGLKDKENASEDINKHLTTTVHLSDTELSAKKKEFTQCVFYLDSLEPNATASIERAIVLLGATQEKFFSKKCTHLITTKNIPIQENMLRSYSDTNKQKYKRASAEFQARDSIVENALSWGIVLWSMEVMLKTVDYFMKVSPFKKKNKQLLEKKALGKVYQEEKLFGPSTGVNNETHSRRPHFVAYTGHYLLIEDASQIHRPVVTRPYTDQLFKKKPSDYPWPFLKITPQGRSPFGKRAPPVKKESLPQPPPPAAAVIAAAKTTVLLPLPSPSQSQSPIVASASIQTTNAATQITTPPATPITGNINTESQYSLRASGYQQSCTNNTQSVSTTIQNDKRLTPGESVNRLDKRMVENVTQKEHQKIHKQVVKDKETRARKEKEKKKDMRYCENCNCHFEKLEEHLKDKTHRTFIRDQNNFKVLDNLLDRIRRPYKEPLPDHWKNLIDVHVDGRNVKFASDMKRSRPDDTNENTNKLNVVNMLKKQATPPVQELGWSENYTTIDVDETLKRISARKGVKAVVILNNEGQAIRSTLDQDLTKKYGQLISALVEQTRTTVATLDDQNDLTFLRVRTKKHEIMIAPDHDYLLIVVQNPTEVMQQ
ncbi:hypothetical protein MFLAVUS_010606 [Mucor flavus]|uniref:DBF4-type domain-containing protein n=1 Tax=Mucor flavus TaxID=439312 RepID=A0ABP9ZD65_9FUNG